MNVKRETLVVNFFAGPGAGKTTCAWEIAAELKKQGLVTEYVPEYAKELVWDNNFEMLDGTAEHQMKLFQEQNRRIQRLIGKVDVIVTDAPILLGTMYCKENTKVAEEYKETVLRQHNAYNNFNLFINRGNNFEKEGRIHNLEESRKIDSDIKAFLDSKNIYYGNYCHQTTNVIVDNIAVTLHRISKEKNGFFLSKSEKTEKQGTPKHKPLRGTPIIPTQGLHR